MRWTCNESVFGYAVAKVGCVTTLRGTDAAKFLAPIDRTDAPGAQLVMAKVTGNFKRGNEKRATRPQDRL